MEWLGTFQPDLEKLNGAGSPGAVKQKRSNGPTQNEGQVSLLFRVILARKTGTFCAFSASALYIPKVRKNRINTGFPSIYPVFLKVELRGIEPRYTASIYKGLRAACDISCDTF